MTLNKLMKVYDRDSYIIVNDLRNGVFTSALTFKEFKDKYGREVMKRKILFIEPDIASSCTIRIDIY